MELPPPYSEIGDDLQNLRNNNAVLERKTTRALAIAESLEDWQKVIDEKKGKGVQLVEAWKLAALELVEKRYNALMQELEDQTQKEKAELVQKLSDLQEVISTSLCLAESVNNVVQRQQEHDVQSYNERLQDSLAELEKIIKPSFWQPALTSWGVRENGSWIVEDVKLVSQPADHADFLSVREIRNPARLLDINQQVTASYVFQYSFKTKTYNDKARCHPQCFAISPSNDIIVPDENNKIVKVFTTGGQLRKTISHPKLLVPGHVCVTKKGELAVIDNATKDIKFFDSTGALMGMSPTLPGPTSLACNSQNQLVVADMAYKAVYTLTENGNETINTIQYYTAQSPHNPSQTQQYPFFQAPHYVHVNNRDQIIVSDRAAGTVLTFEGDGTYIETVGQGEALKDPYGVTCDPSGCLVVAENSPSRISLVGANVTHLITKRQNNIQSPTYAVITDDEKLLVGEYLSGLIKVFAPRGVNVAASVAAEVPPPAYEDVFDMPVVTSASDVSYAMSTDMVLAPSAPEYNDYTSPPLVEEVTEPVYPESQV